MAREYLRPHAGSDQGDTERCGRDYRSPMAHGAIRTLWLHLPVPRRTLRDRTFKALMPMPVKETKVQRNTAENRL